MKRRHLFSKHCCTLLLVTIFLFQPTTGHTEDLFYRYESNVGYGYSVVDMLPHTSVEAEQYVSNPEIEINKGAYIIRITEVMADYYRFYVNIEIELNDPEAILRPMECTIKTEPYYYDYEAVGKPVYFVSSSFSSTQPMLPYQYALGLNEKESKINRLYCRQFTADGDPVMSNGTIDVAVEISVAHYDGYATAEESTQITLTCPVWGAVDWCRVDYDPSVLETLSQWNLKAPEYWFVQTPIDFYFWGGGLSLLDTASGYSAYVALLETQPQQNRWLVPNTDVSEFPNSLYLCLYQLEPKKNFIKIWPLTREGHFFTAD